MFHIQHSQNLTQWAAKWSLQPEEQSLSLFGFMFHTKSSKHQSRSERSLADMLQSTEAILHHHLSSPDTLVKTALSAATTTEFPEPPRQRPWNHSPPQWGGSSSYGGGKQTT